jgi:hypothetical protein
MVKAAGYADRYQVWGGWPGGSKRRCHRSKTQFPRAQRRMWRWSGGRAERLLLTVVRVEMGLGGKEGKASGRRKDQGVGGW